MFKKLSFTAALLFTNLFLLTSKASAEDYGGVKVQDPGTLGDKIVALVKEVGMPIGGSILFFSILAFSIKLALGATNVRKREEAMDGSFYILVSGIVLGAALFISGALLGIGESLAN